MTKDHWPMVPSFRLLPPPLWSFVLITLIFKTDLSVFCHSCLWFCFSPHCKLSLSSSHLCFALRPIPKVFPHFLRQPTLPILISDYLSLSVVIFLKNFAPMLGLDQRFPRTKRIMLRASSSTLNPIFSLAHVHSLPFPFPNHLSVKYRIS